MRITEGASDTANPAGSPKIRDTTPRGYNREDFFRDLTKDEPDSQWEGFKDFVKKIAAVPKEEVDELRAEHEQAKKERRAE